MTVPSANLSTSAIAGLFVVLTAAWAPVLPAAESDSNQPINYTRDGADTCLKCHDETEEFPVLDIFKTRHGHRGDPGSPFTRRQCESCHGPGDEHGGRIRRNEERPAIPFFGDSSPATSSESDAVCRQCHDTGHLANWSTSVHDDDDVGCVGCHQIHTRDDAVLRADTQAEQCFDCHAQQRTDAVKSSSHPVRFGNMTCSDCHRSHDSTTDHSLISDTINETCFTCHADKRGPYLWAHEPAEEDCGLCHRAHGSNHPSLLTRRSPLLCQQCHSRQGHPSLALDGNLLTGGSNDNRSVFLLSQGCGNCHGAVHGSNHPSGVNLTR